MEVSHQAFTSNQVIRLPFSNRRLCTRQILSISSPNQSLTMPEMKESTAQSPASSVEAVEMSTSEPTESKMSTTQIALLMFALCVCCSDCYVVALLTNQSVLNFSRGFGHHYRDDSASNHFGQFPLILGLRVGWCSLHACGWGVDTGLGQDQRHLGTQTCPSHRDWYFLRRKHSQCGLSLDEHVDCGTNCTGYRWWWAPDFVQHCHLGSFLSTVAAWYRSVFELKLMVQGIAPSTTVLSV